MAMAMFSSPPANLAALAQVAAGHLKRGEHGPGAALPPFPPREALACELAWSQAGCHGHSTALGPCCKHRLPKRRLRPHGEGMAV